MPTELGIALGGSEARDSEKRPRLHVVFVVYNAIPGSIDCVTLRIAQVYGHTFGTPQCLDIIADTVPGGVNSGRGGIGAAFRSCASVAIISIVVSGTMLRCSGGGNGDSPRVMTIGGSAASVFVSGL